MTLMILPRTHEATNLKSLRSDLRAAHAVTQRGIQSVHEAVTAKKEDAGAHQRGQCSKGCDVTGHA
jgi:hypothetical protein